MKQNWKQTGKRAGAAALSALLLTGAALPVSATVAPVVDEAFYGTLDYYGGLSEGSVVKSYRTNGNTRIADRGSYDEVINLTDRTEPVISGDRVTFDLGENAPRNFYFEGKTDQPFEEMPFRIQLGYRMNGVEVEPEDMAGEKGVGEILLDVLPNERASAYARNNFAMEAMAVLKDSDILSVEAEGAQVQKIGNLVMVLFLVLPGEEQHFTLRIGAEEFSFGGFTFLVQPATLAQLDMIDELRQAKEETEDSYEAITESLDAILDSLNGMGGTLIETADGLDQLNEAREVLSVGKDRVYDEADEVLASMTEVSDSLSPVVEHLKTAKAALTDTTEQVTTLSDTVQTLRPDLSGLKTSLSAVQLDLDTINLLIHEAQVDTGKLSKELGTLEKDLDDLRDDLDEVALQTGKLKTAVGRVDSIDEVEKITVNQGGKKYTIQQIRDAYEKAETVYSLAKAANEGAEFPGAEDFARYVLTNQSAIYETAARAAFAEQTKGMGLPPEQAEALYGQQRETILGQVQAQFGDSLTQQDTVSMLAYLHYNWTEGDNVKSQLSEADTFNGMIEQANDAIESANDTLTMLKKPTQNLLGSIQTLIDNGNESLLPDSQDLLVTLRSLTDTLTGYDPDALHADVSGLIITTQSLLTTTDTVLEQSKTLTDTMNQYEPDAEKALDDAVTQVNASVKLLNGLNTFTATLENLMKAADPNLDEGSEKSLTGLSKTLRQAKKTLDTTDTIRNANDTIENLLEDKWEEYTGEKNNALNMDADAEMVSLTSGENQTPNSIQLILRSQEIKVDEEAKAAAEAAAKPETTFWDRVMRMCHDFVAIFTGD